MVTQETRNNWKKKIDAVNETTMKRLLILTNWEESFMWSVTERINNNQDLTMQQSIALNSIYRRIG
jgi:hypothetical protein